MIYDTQRYSKEEKDYIPLENQNIDQKAYELLETGGSIYIVNTMCCICNIYF